MFHAINPIPAFVPLSLLQREAFKQDQKKRRLGDTTPTPVFKAAPSSTIVEISPQARALLAKDQQPRLTYDWEI